MWATSAPPQQTKGLWRDRVLLLLAVLPFFLGLGIGLHGSEARWLFVAQEMLRSGNWLEPSILGEFYGDKPLLSYWLIALLAAPFGAVDETTARLPCALAAAGTVWLTAHCALRLGDRRLARVSGLVLATSFSLVFWSRTASADLVSLFFVTAAIAVYLDATRHWRDGHAVLFFVLLALGGNAKGMPGIAVPLAVAGGDVVLERRLPWLRRHGRVLLGGAALGVALYLAPFVASRLVRGDWQLLHLMWTENFVRTFAAFDHTAHALYYVYMLPVMLLPWGLWLPGALASGVRRRREPVERFALLAFATIFALFTLSESRRSYYVLPAFPWAALSIAAYWERLAAARDERGHSTPWERALALWPAGLLGGALCAGGVLLLVGPLLPEDARALEEALPGAPAIALAVLAIGAWLLWALARGRLRAAVGALSAAGLTFSFVYATSVAAALDAYRPEPSFARAAKALDPGHPVVYYGGIGLVLEWYLGPGERVASPEALAARVEARGPSGLWVVCEKAGAHCLDGISGLRVEPLLERRTPALGHWAPSRRGITLLEVRRAERQR